MRKRNSKVVLLLLLALLFGARTLTAQTGWQFFTVVGNPGGSGELAVQFSDADNDYYYATYWYGPADNPTTAAAGLAYILTTTYGTNAFTVSPQGGTLSIAFTPYTIHSVGNGYFSNVWCTPDNGQTMYIVSNGFASPVSTTSSPADPGYDTTMSTSVSLTSDSGITTVTNAPPAPTGSVSIVGIPTFRDNYDGSVSMTTIYSDGTIGVVTYGATVTSAPTDSTAAIAYAEGDPVTAEEIEWDAAIESLNDQLAATEAMQSSASIIQEEEAQYNAMVDNSNSDSGGGGGSGGDDWDPCGDWDY